MEKKGSGSADFGFIDLYQTLSECSGKIEVQLIDAGMVRKFGQEYEYHIDIEDADYICIRPCGRSSVSSIRIPNHIRLTPQFLIFIGMYDGDGNKTGDIGFAQNSGSLQTLAAKGIEAIFPGVFNARVNILEDSKAFETQPIVGMLEGIRADIFAKTGSKPEELEVCREFLRREFKAMNPDLGKIERLDITISPKKGGQSSGSRSYEIIVNRAGSKRFLPLLLSIIKKTISSILDPRSITGINWRIHPQNDALNALDVEAYIGSERCKYIAPRGARSPYAIMAKDVSFVKVRARSLPYGLVIKRFLPVTPLVILMFGIYWAEGTTNKETLVHLSDYRDTDLGIGFNSSENATLQLFFDAITHLFVDPGRIIGSWLVKIGAKYHAETSAVASKLGFPVTRGGRGGDGIARSIEITQVAKKWALEQFPIMKKWERYYSHVEFTGAGIPRVDVRCRPAMARFFFSLMRDLTFFEREIAPFLVSQSPEGPA